MVPDIQLAGVKVSVTVKELNSYPKNAMLLIIVIMK
jgi:hypothetical protein